MELAMLKNADEILETVAMGCRYCFKWGDGFRLINDDTYLRARADMRDFHLKLHQMVKTTDFLCESPCCHLYINVFMNSVPDMPGAVVLSFLWHYRQQP